MFPNLLNSFSPVRYDDLKSWWGGGITHSFIEQTFNRHRLCCQVCARSRGYSGEEDKNSWPWQSSHSLRGNVVHNRPSQAASWCGKSRYNGSTEQGATPTPHMSEQLSIKAKDHHSRKTRICPMATIISSAKSVMATKHEPLMALWWNLVIRGFQGLGYFRIWSPTLFSSHGNFIKGCLPFSWPKGPQTAASVLSSLFMSLLSLLTTRTMVLVLMLV